MPNYLDLLKALNRENVKFVIVGGFAMVVYGASTVIMILISQLPWTMKMVLPSFAP